jgi:exonuclease III
LDFSSLYTVSFADPVFNNSYTKAWIDHILYSKTIKNWVADAKINFTTSSGNPIYKDFPASSDHKPVTCTIHTDNFV